MGQGLARRFFAARGEQEAADAAAVESALVSLVARGRSRAALKLDDGALVEQLAASAELGEGDAAAAIAALSDELVLAAGCVLGDRTALDVIDRTYGQELRTLVGSIVGAAATDVIQDVWSRLLVGRDGKPARLADYGGRGSLLTWLRVVAAREAVSSLRKRREIAIDDDALLGRLVASHDPGLELVRARSAAEVKRAFEEAVAQLTPRERNLLRQSLLDGLTIDELGSLYRVHRATASRWIASAREAVWKHTQRSLRDRLRLSPTEIDSLLGAVREWIDLSLERVL